MSQDDTTARYRRGLAGTANICADCGAFVADRAVHDGFHDRLETVARAANRGDMMTRRIG